MAEGITGNHSPARGRGGVAEVGEGLGAVARASGRESVSTRRAGGGWSEGLGGASLDSLGPSFVSLGKAMMNLSCVWLEGKSQTVVIVRT